MLDIHAAVTALALILEDKFNECLVSSAYIPRS
jgi:hypothetical protein